MLRTLKLLRHVANGARRVALDGALGTRRDFPRTVHDLTPAWMSSVLGARVETLELLDEAAGTSSRARLALGGDHAPPSVFVKMSAASAQIRMLGELAGLGQTETRFYRHLAPQMSGGLPRCHGASFDPITGRFLVVLEDMTRSPCEFPDTLHPLGSERFARLVECLAQLHATFFRSALVRAGAKEHLGWLLAASQDPANAITPSVMKLSIGRLRDRFPSVAEPGQVIAANFQRMVEALDAGPHTVLHGDAHPGNTFFRDGCAGLLDWQVVRRGHPARDLAYAFVLGMPTAERRKAEHELLDRYCHALAAAGGPVFERDDLHRHYRRAVVHPYVQALCTAGLGGMQDDAIVTEGLLRAVSALEDLETVGAYRELLH